MGSRIVLATLATTASFLLAASVAGTAGGVTARSAPGTTAGASTPRSVPAAAGAARPEPLFTVAASRADEAGATGLITCRGAFRDGRAYDRPYASKSSDRQRINAHLAIVCEGARAGETRVKVTSRMKDGRRVGEAESDTGFRTARTGADLGCVRQQRSYWARGEVLITFPDGYDPPSASASPVSVKRAFKRSGGVCVRS